MQERQQAISPVQQIAVEIRPPTGRREGGLEGEGRGEEGGDKGGNCLEDVVNGGGFGESWTSWTRKGRCTRSRRGVHSASFMVERQVGLEEDERRHKLVNGEGAREEIPAEEHQVRTRTGRRAGTRGS